MLLTQSGHWHIGLPLAAATQLDNKSSISNNKTHIVCHCPAERHVFWSQSNNDRTTWCARWKNKSVLWCDSAVDEVWLGLGSVVAKTNCFFSSTLITMFSLFLLHGQRVCSMSDQHLLFPKMFFLVFSLFILTLDAVHSLSLKCVF